MGGLMCSPTLWREQKWVGWAVTMGRKSNRRTEGEPTYTTHIITRGKYAARMSAKNHEWSAFFTGKKGWRGKKMIRKREQRRSRRRGSANNNSNGIPTSTNLPGKRSKSFLANTTKKIGKEAHLGKPQKKDYSDHHS